MVTTAEGEWTLNRLRPRADGIASQGDYRNGKQGEMIDGMCISHIHTRLTIISKLI